jgi:hypothetical protein
MREDTDCLDSVMYALIFVLSVKRVSKFGTGQLEKQNVCAYSEILLRHSRKCKMI